ncbi:hypothetical protein HCB26_12115, partial [Listeria booriae]
MLNNKMKKAASIMAVAALIGTSVTTPLGALTTKAAESQPQSQPSTLAVLNPNLLSQDISVSATNSKRFATNWNLTSGAAYTTLGYDTNGGAVATDAVGNIFHLTNASMSMQTTFKARTNVAVSQTIDTEIGKEYTYTSRFYLDESVGPGPTRTMVNRNITLQINDSTPRTLIGLNQGIVNGYEGTFSFVATSTKTNITLASIGTSSTRDYRLFQTLQSIKKSDKQVQQDAIALEQQAQQAVNNLFNGSNPANVIKTGLTQSEIDAAQNLVNQVTDETKKAAFQKNLDNAKKQLNDRIDAENKAQDVVNNLFENKDPNGDITGNVTKDDIDAAQDLIDKLANTTKKAELQTALNKAKQQLTDRIEATEKEAQDKANEAVTNLFENNDPDGDIVGNLTQDDLDKAQDLINKVTDETKKAELQRDLDRAKQQLTDRTEATEKEAQDKANEAVTNLFENNDPDGDIVGNLTQDD